LKKRRGHLFFKVGWFININLDDPTKTAQYNYQEDRTNIIPYTSILHHSIEFTALRRLKAGDVRLIDHILNINQ
jgi:hypothetical protein